ncbi:hypothetical protein EV361DRAFT_920963 [Lentinula raphanica]|uniref:Uncharacterized protein n=1 Tax=Lentinula raphanica TaxID=153919 RepID=A0AA38UDR3_9AGAR|nr:hypothetical protein F5878DRAFT_621609 [Lentinula raphanica]KAJ3969412.1 hypothetical protein EV361DRAFT_920963 [Lentinula raphanica]
MLEVLSRALKDAQDHTSKLESELEAALKESDDLRKRNVRLTADLAEMLDTKSVKIENATASEFPAASEKETITTLNIKVEEAQEGLRAAESQVIELTAKCTQLKQQRREMRDEMKSKSKRVAELEEAITDLHEKYRKCKEDKEHVQSELKDVREQSMSLEIARTAHDHMKKESAKIHNDLKSRVMNLPMFSSRPKFEELVPITNDTNVDILKLLRNKAPSYHWVEQSVFYVPKGLVLLGPKQHGLRFTPVSSILPESEFRAANKRETEIKELITQSHQGLIYLGLYKRYIPKCVPPTGMMLPNLMPDQLNRLVEEANDKGRMTPSTKSSSEPPATPSSFRNGTNKVIGEIYQCVGFNQDLYNTLTQHSKPNKKRSRPGTDSEARPEQGPSKKYRGVPLIQKSTIQRK